MSSQPSWRPNVPGSQLYDEKTWLQGAIISAVVYGVNLALFILNVSLLSTRIRVDIKQNGRASRQTTYLLTYVCVMFILSTLTVASQAEMTQLGFIDNRDFPGGPAAYQELMFSIPISSLGNYCFSMMNWFSDSLLLWRCSVIYKSSRAPIWLVMAIPGLMLLASFVTGIIYLERISRASSPWDNATFTLVYVTISLSLNILLTLMIVIRLYFHRRRSAKLFGRRHAADYTSIIAMLIESAAIMDIMVIWFLIPFALGNPLANIPLSSMGQLQATASFMIIFRVAQGNAWTSRTAYSEDTIHGMPERVGGISNIRFHTASVERDPADSPVIPRYRNQFTLDGPRDVLDTESNSHGTVYESSPREPIIEKVRPNAN